MKVYVVGVGHYSDWGIECVFSTEEKAKEYINGGDGYSLEEYELDAEQDRTNKRFYESVITLEDGEIYEVNADEELYEINNKNARVPRYDEYYDEGWAPHNTVYRDKKRLHVRSYVGQEHVNKLAAEARQAYLRGEVFSTIEDLIRAEDKELDQ